MSRTVRDRLVALRRDLHQHPEPAWREFQTTSRLVDELERTGVDDLYVGRDAIAPDERMAVPDDDELETWLARAREAGAREDVLDRVKGGYTGAVAVLRQGEHENGPTVGLRVDIDALPITEDESGEHEPAEEGFQSRREGYMHACGHDAHMTLGIGVIEAIKESTFEGTLKVFFQPAEEESGGGKAMAESGHLDDVDHLLAVHVGLGHPTGEIVAGIIKPLAMAHITADFGGSAAHAGKEPNEGDNTIQAAAAAIQNVYGIPRHADGMTRVNVGRIEGGTASNVIAEETTLWGEVRGETTELMEYTKREYRRTFESAAEMHGCDVDVNVVSESPRADSDPGLAAVVADAAADTAGVENIVPEAEFGASEDATFLMQKVQEQGGEATYAIVGTDHPGDHHTPTFDVDEDSLEIGVDVLAGAIQRLEQPNEES